MAMALRYLILSNPAFVGFIGRGLRAYRQARWHAMYQDESCNRQAFQSPLCGPVGFLP